MLVTNGFASAPFTANPGTSGNAGANSLYTTKITLLKSATISAIWVNGVGSTLPLSWRGVIYDSAHSALVAQSTLQTMGYQGANRLPLSPSVVLAAGTYYVGYVADAGASVSIDSSQANSSWFVSGGLNATTPPNPLASGIAQSNGLLVALEFDGSTASPSGWAPDCSNSVTISGAGNNTATFSTANIVNASVWNPIDKSVNIGLSNGNLAAQPTTSSDGAVRASTSGASGTKFYFETSYASGAMGGTDTGVGIATSAANLGTIGTNATLGFLVYSSGNIWYNGSSASITIGAPGTGTICVAIDLVNKRGWIRLNNGNWNNSGTANPTTNVGGVDLSTVFASAAAYPIASFNNTSPVATINCGATSYAFTPPSGFGNLPIGSYNVAPSGAVRSIAARAPGAVTKVYAEIAVSGTVVVDALTAIGVVSATFPMGGTPDFNNKICQVTSANGTPFGTITTAGTGVSFAAGDVVGIAYDVTNGYLWFNKNNSSWIGAGGTAGNPATGTNPINITLGGAPVNWPVCIAAFADAATVFTLRDTAGLQAYAPPSGFVAWTPLQPTAAQLTQIAIEEWAVPVPIAILTQIAIEEWALVGIVLGKFYFEITATTIVGAGGAGVSMGIATTTSTYTGIGTNATTGVVLFTGNGTIFANGVNSGLTGLGAVATGDVIGIAVDLDNHNTWFRKAPSGNWNGQALASQNPVGNVGGVAIPAGSITPICTFGGAGGTTGNVFTANFGGSAFVGAVPVGFLSGWGS